ncbi:hypothetical protein M885DRAFT_500755 [Pelagophyceae sp. CCMP2097]|nr:hypothetical protein M885DRAFT_500755 [Pelagophyceae sp. CCMP2097]
MAALMETRSVSMDDEYVDLDPDSRSLGSHESIQELVAQNELLTFQAERILGGMRLLMRDPLAKYARPLVRGYLDRRAFKKQLAAVALMQNNARMALARKDLQRAVKAAMRLQTLQRTRAVCAKTAIGSTLAGKRRLWRQATDAHKRLQATSVDNVMNTLRFENAELQLAKALRRPAELCARLRATDYVPVETCRAGGFTIEECAQAGYDTSTFDWRTHLAVGAKVDAKDCQTTAPSGVIVAAEESRVRVHYRGWREKWDAWYSREANDLQPARTFVEDWRSTIEPGDRVEVCTPSPKKKKPLWYIGIIVAVEGDRVQVVEWQKLKTTRALKERTAPWFDVDSEDICKSGTHFKRAAGPAQSVPGSVGSPLSPRGSEVEEKESEKGPSDNGSEMDRPESLW